LPVVSNRLPFFVKIAIREFTICTMWSGPTARVLSEGFRPVALPCGPTKPTPRPSKLATMVAGARVPWVVCSMDDGGLTASPVRPAAVVITQAVMARVRM
jgi:hypothetical protein